MVSPPRSQPQQPQPNVVPLWKSNLYKRANLIWKVSTWIWTTLIIAFLLEFVPPLFTKRDPLGALQGTWTAQAINWLTQTNPHPELETLRWVALVSAIVLVITPLATSLLKYTFPSAAPKAPIERLAEVLQYDQFSPALQQRIEELIAVQETEVRVLRQIRDQLQKDMPTSGDLWQMYNLAQSEQKVHQTQIDIQKASADEVIRIAELLRQSPSGNVFQELRQDLNYLLQAMQARNIKQDQELQKLYIQEFEYQGKITASLGRITQLLEHRKTNAEMSEKQIVERGTRP